MSTKKILLSVWIIFHVIVVVLFPNSLSYLNRVIGPLSLPYTNLFGLHSAWSFYAPDPETARYLEYTLTYQDPTRDRLTQSWPPPRTKFFDTLHNRYHTSMSFFVMKSEWVKDLFIPWICRTHPGAAFVTANYVLIKVPTLLEVQNGASIFDPNLTTSTEMASVSCSVGEK